MLTKEKLNELIYDTYDVGQRIKAVDKLISSLNDELLKEHYTRSLLEMIAGFEQMCIIVNRELNEYLKAEKDSGLPTTFIYAKLAKLLDEFKV